MSYRKIWEKLVHDVCSNEELVCAVLSDMSEGPIVDWWEEYVDCIEEPLAQSLLGELFSNEQFEQLAIAILREHKPELFS